MEKLKIVKEAASTLFNDYKSRYGGQSEQLGELSQFSSNVANVSSPQSLDVRSQFKKMRASLEVKRQRRNWTNF